MAARLPDTLGDAATWLSADEVAELAAAGPRLAAMCGELAAFAVPATLLHGDLHLSNVAKGPAGYLFFDWTDACIAHPFLDMITVFHEEDGALRDRLRDAYLAELENPRTPTGRVGVRAPHLPVEIDGAPGSVHDVLGRGFALLAAPGGQRWLAAASQAGVVLGCPVSGYRVASDGDLVDKGEAFAKAYGLGRDGAVLVRPDAVVAWRAPAQAGDPHAAVEEALRRLLFRQP